jgi:hypothetical protein
MKYTIDDENMRDYSVMTPQEIAEQFVNSGVIELQADERIGEVRLESGTDLEIDIEKVIENDPRCSGYVDHTETFDRSDIEYHFEAADYYVWAKDEDGNDVLMCFGC